MFAKKKTLTIIVKPTGLDDVANITETRFSAQHVHKHRSADTVPSYQAKRPQPEPRTQPCRFIFFPLSSVIVLSCLAHVVSLSDTQCTQQEPKQSSVLHDPVHRVQCFSSSLSLILLLTFPHPPVPSIRLSLSVPTLSRAPGTTTTTAAAAAAGDDPETPQLLSSHAPFSQAEPCTRTRSQFSPFTEPIAQRAPHRAANLRIDQAGRER